MNLSIGRANGGLLRQLGQWVVAAAIIGTILSAKDIERYLKIRSMSDTLATYRVVSGDSAVVVDGKSTGHAMHATSSQLSGTLEVTLGEDGKPDLSQPYSAALSFPAASLSAGGMADREMRRRLDVEKFPTIKIAVREAREKGDGAYHAVAEVTAKGVTKQVNGSVAFAIRGDAIVVEGSEAIDMRDFGIDPPKLLMLKVDPMVTVIVKVTARPDS